MKDDKRYIEYSFPIIGVSLHSTSEKSIRQSHPATLHIWWARRPLAASRIVCYTALIPPLMEKNEREQKQQFLVDFSSWKNTLNTRMIELARKEILDANDGRKPRVLDPFAGGGSIPLESLRLGCETYSADLNPVAILIQKCTLEYPQKYGRLKPLEVQEQNQMLAEQTNPLLDDLKMWSEKVLDRMRSDLEEYYTDKSTGNTVVGYIWARTIICQNPSCGAEIPLMRQYWLSRKKERRVSLYPFIENGGISYRIVGHGYEKMPKGFDPRDGTVKGAVATCLVCNSTVDANTTRRLLKQGASTSKLVCKILMESKKTGKIFRTVSDDDRRDYDNICEVIEKHNKELLKEWGIQPIPDEPTPEGKGRGAERAFSVRNIGINTWGDLFNKRQALSLILISKYIRQVHQEMIDEGYNSEYARAISTYLAFNLDFVADHNSSLCQWRASSEDGGHTFGRAALPISWDYFEINPISGSTGSFQSGMKKLFRIIEGLSSLSMNPAQVNQGSSTKISYPDDYFDAIFTDPPYYDNIPYSYLSDFFYVWLKRSIGSLYPDLFSTPLSPKSNEIVAYSHQPGGFEEGKRFFEEMLGKSFKEMHRVLKSAGIAVIVYAHKSTEGWETLINSLLDSNLVITGAWPLHTEMPGRLRARESAALSSSIYIVARKMDRQSTAIYKDVKDELETHLERKLKMLWQEGIGGADFFIAAIGSAIEVFGKYEQVIDYEGNVVRGISLLEDVRQIATRFAVQQILHNGFSESISSLTRYYILYRWNYQDLKVHFDEARKLAQSCGIDLTNQWGDSAFIRKQKEFIEVVGPKERKIEDLEDSTELIDILHHILLLWEKGRKDKISIILSEKKLENNEIFWRIAQAISETLPTQNKEKKLLDGFLAGRTGYQSEDRYEQETLG